MVNLTHEDDFSAMDDGDFVVEGYDAVDWLITAVAEIQKRAVIRGMHRAPEAERLTNALFALGREFKDFTKSIHVDAEMDNSFNRSRR